MPPITELTRIEPVYLARLEKQGVFTTGILLEVSETPTRRQYLADHVKATTNDVTTWRDEALLLNLAGFGSDEHQLFIQADIEGLRELLSIDLATFRARLERAAAELNWRRRRPADGRDLVGAGADPRGGVVAGRDGPPSAGPTGPSRYHRPDGVPPRRPGRPRHRHLARAGHRRDRDPAVPDPGLGRVRAGPRASGGLDRLHDRAARRRSPARCWSTSWWVRPTST